MRKLVARIMVAGAVAAFAVPTLACDAMKRSTTASTTEKTEPKKDVKAEKKVEKKTDKVASAEKKL
jgi:hypothetical protein